VAIMLSKPVRVANTREHISWSHRFAFFWLVLALVLFGGAYALAEIGDMSESSRTLMFVMLGAIIVTNAIWQAAGLALARLENVMLPRMKGPVSHD
jgi:membrane-anchored protein YejM (alkaline phosphatase superfamily)